MDPSFRIRELKLRSDSFLGLRLGWRQRGNEIVRVCACRATLFEGVHKKKKIIVRSKCRSRTVRSSTGSIRKASRA